MTPDAFIEQAIARGQEEGIEALDSDQRLVFLIAEAETLADMEGVEAFLRNYAPEWLEETVAAFESVGATKIAAELPAVPQDAGIGDARLERLNELVTSRAGYDYEAIRRVVSDRLTRRVE